MSAPALVARLTELGQTVAVAESLTAGLVMARLADVPGASAVLRGAVVAYAADLKVSLLGVPAELVEQQGVVAADVAAAMAAGVAARLGADHGLATTGVAGPDTLDGKPPGTVYVAHAGPAGVVVRALHLPGDRAEVRLGSVSAVLELFLGRL
jgi:nicotinamide-nucleotide amidase